MKRSGDFIIIDENQWQFSNKPSFKKMRGKNWISYGTSTNDYARYLLDLFRDSELHSAIIKTKAHMIAGDLISIPDDLNTKLFLDNLNKYGGLDSLIYKWALDLELFGSFNIETIWNRAHNKVAEFNHIDTSKILYGEKVDGVVNEYYFSEDWEQYRKEDYAPIQIPKFMTSNEAREIMNYIPSYEPGLEYYTLPEYIATTKAIEVDINIMDFHLSNITNNFQPGKIITIIGEEPDDEKKEEIRQRFKETFSGTENAGKTMISYSPDKDSAPIIQTISLDNLDKMFKELAQDIQGRILMGHGIPSPLLVGIKTAGQLGGSDELEQGKELLMKYRIMPKRKAILDAINTILSLNGLKKISIEDNIKNNEENGDN